MSRGEYVDPLLGRSSRLPTAVSRDRKSRLPYERANSLKPDSSPWYSCSMYCVCVCVCLDTLRQLFLDLSGEHRYKRNGLELMTSWTGKKIYVYNTFWAFDVVFWVVWVHPVQFRISLMLDCTETWPIANMALLFLLVFKGIDHPKLLIEALVTFF